MSIFDVEERMGCRKIKYAVIEGSLQCLNMAEKILVSKFKYKDYKVLQMGPQTCMYYGVKSS